MFIPKGMSATWAYCAPMHSQPDSESYKCAFSQQKNSTHYARVPCSEQVLAHTSFVQDYHIQRLCGWQSSCKSQRPHANSPQSIHSSVS